MQSRRLSAVALDDRCKLGALGQHHAHAIDGNVGDLVAAVAHPEPPIGLDLEETERAVSDMHAAPRGDLRVNATPCLGAYCLGPAIADFAARFPNISVELMVSDRLVDMIEEGFDVSVRCDPLSDSRLIARHLAPCRLVVCGAPSYFEKHGMPRTPADLKAHNCLTLAGSGLSYYRVWHLTAADGTALNFSPVGNLRTNSAAVLKMAALAGRGLVCLPTFIIGDALESGRLVMVLDDYLLPPLMVRALYPHNRHLSAKVRAFVDFVAARFSESALGPLASSRRALRTAAPCRNEMIASSIVALSFLPAT